MFASSLRGSAVLRGKLLHFNGNLPALDTFLALCHNPMKAGVGTITTDYSEETENERE